MTLDEFREANPAYKGVSDRELADALYSKYYSSVPREEFNSKVGFKPEPTGPLTSVARGGNVGTAKLLGAPVDLMNTALSAVGLDSEEPVGGSEFLRKQYFERVAPGSTYSDPRNLAPQDRPFAAFGETAIPAVIPGAAALRMGAPGAQVPSLVKPIQEAIRANPKGFMATEAASAVGAGIGAFAAEIVAPENKLVRFGAEVLGGFGSPAAIATRGGPKVIGAIKRAFMARTKSGRTAEAARVVQEELRALGIDPAELGRALEREYIETGGKFPGTAAQLSGNPALMAMERALAAANRKFGNVKVATEEAVNQYLRDGIEVLSASGDPQTLVAAAKLRESYFNKLLQGRIERAEAAANTAALRAMRGVGGDPARAQMDASRDAYDALRQSLISARQAESALWEGIPKEIVTPASNLRGKVMELQRDLLPGESITAAVPGRAGQFLRRLLKDERGFPSALASGDLLTLRSQSLEAARVARGGASPNFALAQRYDEIAEGALADLNALDNPAIETARTFSRSLNDTFTRSIAGKVLQKSRAGGLKDSPESLLDRALAGKFTIPEQQFGELRAAARFGDELTGVNGLNAQMVGAQEQFLRANAAQLIGANGRVNPEKLRAFTVQNGEALKKFPDLQNDLMDLESAERVLNTVMDTTSQASKAIRGKAAFSRVIEKENPVDAVSAAIRQSKTPVRDYQNLARLAQHGRTDGAVEGLRTATVDHVMQAGGKGESFSWVKVRDALNAPVSRNQPSLSTMMQRYGVADGAFIARLNKVIERGAKMEEAAASGLRIDTNVQSADSVDDLVRGLGAKYGSALHKATGLGGSSLFAAGLGARRLRSVLEKVPAVRVQEVLIEAAENPKLMAALLQRPTSAANAEALRRQVNGFLIQAGIVPDEQRQ